MKKLTNLLFAIVALLMVSQSASAWEPVIKERHWFGLMEEYAGPFHISITWANTNYIESIQGYKEWDGRNGGTEEGEHHVQKASFYSWTDHKLRFKVNVTGNWEINRNEHDIFKGVGLYNKSANATNFWICNLEAGDQFILEYYRDKNNNSVYPFLVTGTVEGKTAASTGSSSNAIWGTETYTATNGGDLEFNIPSKTVIRSVTIIKKNYKKASYEIKEITEGGNKGYEYTLTGSGVLEEKRGAVPYITMRFGSENDMTFVRDLGDFYGERFGAASIIDDTNDFNPETAKVQAAYREKNEEQVKFLHSGKEWTMFSADVYTNPNYEEGSHENGKQYKYSDDFSSIIPHYGTYYYFFPEVKGKLKMRFYCEGNREHVAFWCKHDYTQNKDDYAPNVGTSDNTNGDNFYEYNVEVNKGVYYLCSNPTIVQHQLPIVRLISYSFIPEFRVDPLYKVVENGTENVEGAAEIFGGPFSDLNGNVTGSITINGESAPKVKYLGNIVSAEPVVVERDGRQFLDIKNIKFKDGENVNKGGVVVVNLECSAGKATYVLTVAYDAAEKNLDGTAVSEEVKKWDFYTEPLKIGKYSDGSGTYPSDAWTNSSQLYKEVHKADGLTSDWTKTYMNLHDNSEPIFKSVYDMEGDNADMLEETEGLIFLTEANQLGIYNENDKSTKDKFNDRYIGLLPGGKLIIPKLSEGDRIVIKMNRYGTVNGKSEAHLEIGNGKDAIGTDINSDYIIGGSDVTESIPDKSQPHGEYHFIAKGGDFSLTLTDGPLLKLYTIEIYKHENTIITENEVLGDNRYILYTSEDNGAKTTSINLHYNGKGEPFAYLQTAKKTGKFKNENISFEQSGNKFNYTPASNLFGTFRPRLAVRTTNSAYVTDYADYSIAVGYRETKEYPYTWDFTDLKKYVKESNQIDENGNEKDVDDDVKIWKNYSLQVRDPETEGGLFVNGSQLYAGDKMFDESAGIGIHHFNYNKNHNGKLTITDEDNGGLRVTDGTQAWKFIVPQVKTGQAIYVRAAKTDDEVKAKYIETGTTEADFTKKVETDGDEVVFMMKKTGDANAKGDVSLCFQGYEVKKIAVATDEKKVNVKGYASESRNHDIDTKLLPYFTGQNFKTYMLSEEPDYANHTLTMTDAGSSEANYVLQSHTGCVIYKGAEGEFNPFNDGKGFHLFVPDMHDQTGKYVADNIRDLNDGVSSNYYIKPQLTEEEIEMFDGDKTNYVLTYRYYELDEDGNPKGEATEGPERFYRVSANKIWLRANSAYLQLPTEKVKPGTAGAKFSFLFTDSFEDPTDISEVFERAEPVAQENAQWYNLNGQKLNGRPQGRGLYIVNGKKMIVK